MTLRSDYSGDLGEGKVGLEPCLTMLAIGPLSARDANLYNAVLTVILVVPHD